MTSQSLLSTISAVVLSWIVFETSLSLQEQSEMGKCQTLLMFFNATSQEIGRWQ